MLTTYLNFKGNTEEVFRFYEKALNGTITMISKFNEMPDTSKVPEQDLDKVMHVSLDVNGQVLMGSDIPSDREGHFKQGNNFSISIDPGSIEQTEKVFHALSEGGHILMPLEHTFWGAYFGMFVDKFGINWMVNHNTNQGNNA